MDYRDKAIQTQLANIQERTGRSLTELGAEMASWGELKHGELRARLQQTYGLSFVHADTLILCLRQMRDERAGAAQADPLDEIYSGAKAALRPIHEAFVARIAVWGDYEAVPKKGYVSYRRKKQFCMLGPATKSRVALGLNAKALAAGGRLKVLPPGKLCPFEIDLTDPAQVDDELIGWVRTAWEQAG